MPREDAAQAHTRCPRRQVDRHAITLIGHLLVTGVLLERRLTASMRVGGRVSERRTPRPLGAREIQRKSMSSQPGNEEL
jgi:hypothetical protein